MGGGTPGVPKAKPPDPPAEKGVADRDSTNTGGLGPPVEAGAGSVVPACKAWKGFAEGSRVVTGFLPLGGMVARCKKVLLLSEAG